ncbi:hypothetical protein GUJ93_ZPchr0003g17598 [Zizania palustris]|uniref:Uncharacterized protein n=1 Tax=Zizania palustris TaxID=103762 RepID=A0A8J5S7U1_ZIZPA|nr:hypothetical protein GUJ93_ZPchr0003g17598 [Zizania palustris]
MLWRHFAAGGCEGMTWVFNAVFNASLLALFLDFHGAAYAAATKGTKKSSKARLKQSDGRRDHRRTLQDESGLICCPTK